MPSTCRFPFSWEHPNQEYQKSQEFKSPLSARSNAQPMQAILTQKSMTCSWYTSACGSRKPSFTTRGKKSNAASWRLRIEPTTSRRRRKYKAAPSPVEAPYWARLPRSLPWICLILSCSPTPDSMSNTSKQSKSVGSKTPTGLSYSEAIEIVRKSFARHGIEVTLARPSSQPKESSIEVTFIKRKKN